MRDSYRGYRTKEMNIVEIHCNTPVYTNLDELFKTMSELGWKQHQCSQYLWIPPHDTAGEQLCEKVKPQNGEVAFWFRYSFSLKIWELTVLAQPVEPA